MWLEVCSPRTLLIILDIETDFNPDKLPAREGKIMDWLMKLFKDVATAKEAKNIIWTAPSVKIKSVDDL